MSEDFIDSVWTKVTIKTHQRYYGIFLEVNFEYKLTVPDDVERRFNGFTIRNIITNGQKVDPYDLTDSNIWNIKDVIFNNLSENDKKFLKQYKRKKLFGIF